MSRYLLAKITQAGTIFIKDYTPHQFQGASYDVKSDNSQVAASNVTSIEPTEPHGQIGFIVHFMTPVDFTYSPPGQPPHILSLTEAQVQLGDFTTDGTAKLIATATRWSGPAGTTSSSTATAARASTIRHSPSRRSTRPEPLSRRHWKWRCLTDGVCLASDVLLSVAPLTCPTSGTRGRHGAGLARNRFRRGCRAPCRPSAVAAPQIFSSAVVAREVSRGSRVDAISKVSHGHHRPSGTGQFLPDAGNQLPTRAFRCRMPGTRRRIPMQSRDVRRRRQAPGENRPAARRREFRPSGRPPSTRRRPCRPLETS